MQNERNIEMKDFIDTHEAKMNLRWYPKFHVAPRCGWCNDPNGVSYFNGEYHLFYQYYPYEPKWGPMHWAHDTSKDLVHWTRQPVALYPDMPYDKGGCFSGCAYPKDGKLYLVYTGHVDVEKKPGGPDRIETQNVAVSTDGISFEKLEANPVMTLPENVSSGEDKHFRDPKVWEHEGRYYCVVGAQTAENVGQVLLFDSEDLVSWSFRQVMAKAEGNQGFMWECPNFAMFDGKEALILSPQGVKPEGKLYLNIHQSGIMVGELDYTAGIFEHGAFELLDYGFDFYAPQVMQTPDDRCLMYGWLSMWESKMPEQEDGWAGLMTVPRELHYRNGHVVSVPARELAALRQKEYPQNNITTSSEFSIAEWEQETGELCADFKLDEADGVSVIFEQGTEAQVKLSVNAKTGEVELSRYSLLTGELESRFANLTAGLDAVSVRVFADRSSLEFFLNDGEVVMSTRFYPKSEKRSITFAPENGSVKMENGVFYELGSAF